MHVLQLFLFTVTICIDIDKLGLRFAMNETYLNIHKTHWSYLRTIY
jgi:hypothetical protein